MTTEAEQVVAMCKWLGLEYPTSDITTHEDYDPVIWWSREGWWRALEAWKGTGRHRVTWISDDSLAGSAFTLLRFVPAIKQQSGMNMMYRPETVVTSAGYDTPSAAALAALQEAMEKRNGNID